MPRSVESPVFSSVTVKVVPDSRRKPEVPTVSSLVEGVSLRVARGTADTLPARFGRRRTRALKAAGDRYASAKLASDRLDSLAVPIIQVTHDTNESVRGVVSDAGNYGILSYPSETTVYDPDLLRQSLQEFYPNAVQESAHVSFDLPDVGDTPEGRTKLRKLVRSFRRVLRNAGYSREFVDNGIQVGLLISIQQARINDIVKAGQAELLEGTRTTSTEWKLKFGELDKERPVTPGRQRRRSPTIPKMKTPNKL